MHSLQCFFFSCLKKLNFFFHVQNIFILLYSTNKISMPSIIFFLLVRCAYSPSVPSPSSLLSNLPVLFFFLPLKKWLPNSHEDTESVAVDPKQTIVKVTLTKIKRKEHRSKIIVFGDRDFLSMTPYIWNFDMEIIMRNRKKG